MPTGLVRGPNRGPTYPGRSQLGTTRSERLRSEEQWPPLWLRPGRGISAGFASGRRGRQRYSRDVKVRLLALSLAAWVAFYGWVYIMSMRDQGSTPYWWYLAIIGAGAVPPLLTAAGLRSRLLLICDAVILGVAAILALPSQGMLLLPGVVAAAVIAILSPAPCLTRTADADRPPAS